MSIGFGIDLNSFINLMRLSMLNLNIFVLVCLLFLQPICSAELRNEKVNPIQMVRVDQPNLQFSNSTGPGVTDEMLKNYINIINAASAFYKDNVESNIRYIKQKLDALYADDQQNFILYINDNDPQKYGYSIWISYKRITAELNAVNIVNPSWSYLIIKTYKPVQKTSVSTFITGGSVGPGIDFRAKLAIKDIIETFEIDDGCSCSQESVANIRKSCESYFNGSQFKQFNVMCDSTGVTSALVYALDGVWGAFKGKCYYTISKNS